MTVRGGDDGAYQGACRGAGDPADAVAGVTECDDGADNDTRANSFNASCNNASDASSYGGRHAGTRTKITDRQRGRFRSVQ